MAYISFYFISALSIATYCNAADETDISRLRADLLMGYDRHARPIQSNSKTNPTIVDMYFYNSGFEFDEKQGTLTLHCMPVINWLDRHIKWDPLNYGNLTEVQFRRDELWTPDISVLNNRDTSEIDHYGNTLLSVYSTSIIYWVPPAKFQVGCKTDYLLWPYDTQTCEIFLVSWAHDGSEIHLTVHENHTEMQLDNDWGHPYQNREWLLISNAVEKNVFEYQGIPQTEIQIRLTIQRRSPSHSAAITVVALGITAAILISFWLSPFSNERVPIILVSIFLNSVYLNHIYKMIPNNGDTVPLAVRFFRDSLVMVTTALAWTILLRYIAQTKRNSPVPLPDLIQKFLDSIIAKMLCVSPRPITKTDQSEVQQRDQGFDDNFELVKNGNPYQEDWAWLAHLMDRIAFVAFLITYFYFILRFM